MAQQLDTTHVLLENELIIYRRERSNIWQCRYKVGGMWQRSSTKERDIKKAKVKAKDLMVEAEIRKRNNIPVVTRRFGDIAKLVVKKMREDVAVGANTKGIKSYKDYIVVIEKYLIPVLGKKLITNIDYAALQELEAERIKIMCKVPSRSTLLTHNAALNKVFKEAEVRGYLTELNKPILEVKGIKSKVRPAFTIAEIHVLLTKFKGWITQSTNKQTVLMRELMFDYINVLLDTGTRPGKELLNLRWQQIEPSIKPVLKKTGEFDGEGKGEDNEVAIANLNRSVLMHVDGKTGERDILGMQRTVEALVRLGRRNYNVEMPLIHPLKNIAVANNSDYVFVTANGSRPTNFNNMFTKFLTRYNLLLDPKTGQNRVLYSLLRNLLNVNSDSART